MPPPTRMDPHEIMRYRAAALRATRIYPGAIGQLISREIIVWSDFGYRLGEHSVVREAVDQIMKTTAEESPYSKTA